MKLVFGWYELRRIIGYAGNLRLRRDGRDSFLNELKEIFVLFFCFSKNFHFCYIHFFPITFINSNNARRHRFPYFFFLLYLSYVLLIRFSLYIFINISFSVDQFKILYKSISNIWLYHSLVCRMF